MTIDKVRCFILNIALFVLERGERAARAMVGGGGNGGSGGNDGSGGNNGSGGNDRSGGSGGNDRSGGSCGNDGSKKLLLIEKLLLLLHNHLKKNIK